MKKIIFIMLGGLLVSLVAAPQEKVPTPIEIMDRIDKNMVFGTAYSEIEMILTISGRTLSKTMTSYSRGNEKSFIEFLSPARDKGTKILKTADIIQIYYPSAERVMRLSGHMLRQSMMGSDFSFEDMTERSKKLREEYSAVLAAEASLGGRPCFVLVLTSRIEKQTYYTRKIWVDRERYLGLKEELYSKSGKLLKVLTVNDVESIDERYYPVKITMEDKLRNTSKTEMIVRKIDFDITIPEAMFSERQLLKK
ncbi:MAG: outer membrane lipoprotein-sorting protein [Chrysiogenia bacterium]